MTWRAGGRRRRDRGRAMCAVGARRRRLGGTAEVSLRKLVNNADMDIPTCGSSLASLASVYK